MVKNRDPRDLIAVLPEGSVLLQGTWVYVRQCEKDEELGGGLFRAEKDAARSHVCEILAIGPWVGRPRRESRRWCHRRRIPKHTASDWKVGDLAILPDIASDGMLLNSPYSKYEFFVDESQILAKVVDDV